MARTKKRQVVIGWCPSLSNLPSGSPYDTVVQVFNGKEVEFAFRFACMRRQIYEQIGLLSSYFGCDVIVPHDGLVGCDLPLTDFDEFSARLSR